MNPTPVPELERRLHLTTLRERVKAAASGLGTEIATHFEDQKEAIMAMTEWSELPADERALFSGKLDDTTLPEAIDIAGFGSLLNRRMELDATLSGIRTAVMDRHRHWIAKKSQPPAGEPAPDSDKSPVKIRVRRRYGSGDQAALEQTIRALATGLKSLGPGDTTEVAIDLD